MKNILVVLGTRPEVIKLAPVILELKKSENFNVEICNTEQQKELSNQTLSVFNLKADINLDVMQPNQTLADVQARILSSLSKVFLQKTYDAVIVQGDTMTVFCGALLAFYNKIPVFHVEAGLRSYDLYEPFPEEALRQMVTRISSIHFAPTNKAAEALLKEGIDKNNIYMTGNTVVDALLTLPEEVKKRAKDYLEKLNVKFNDKLVLVTVHRRENHGKRLDEIIDSLLFLSKKYKEHQFVIPVHPNPNVKNKLYHCLGNKKNILLLPPVSYPELISLMSSSKLILTDSGGIQEEAPTFGVPVLVLRYETERTEGVDAGFAKLIGAEAEKIISSASYFLEQDKSSILMNSKNNPYGIGNAAVKIRKIIENYFFQSKKTK